MTCFETVFKNKSRNAESRKQKWERADANFTNFHEFGRQSEMLSNCARQRAVAAPRQLWSRLVKPLYKMLKS